MRLSFRAVVAGGFRSRARGRFVPLAAWTLVGALLLLPTPATDSRPAGALPPGIRGALPPTPATAGGGGPLTPVFNGSCSMTASTAGLNCTGMNFSVGDTFVAVVFDYQSSGPRVVSSSFDPGAIFWFRNRTMTPGTPGVTSSPSMFAMWANATRASAPGWVNVSISSSGFLMVEWWLFPAAIGPIPRLVGPGSQGSSDSPYDPLSGTAAGDTLISVFASTRPTGFGTVYGTWNYTGGPANPPGSATDGMNGAASWAYVDGSFRVPDPWWILPYSTYWTALSFTVSGSSPTTPPSAPTGLVVGNVTRSTVDLAWTNPTGTVTNLTVWYSPGSCPLRGPVRSISAGVVSAYRVGGLGSSADYCFAVAAWNENGSSGLSAPVHAITPPLLGYQERTYDLPGFDPLTGYFRTGTVSTQVPTLASSSGVPFGVYYVDNSSQFGYVAIPNGSFRSIAPVIPLYQRFGYGSPLNGMLDNEFFLAGDRALFFGTTSPAGADVTLELVNVTDGQVLLWNTSAAVDPTNQQPEYVGNNTVLVLSSNCSIEAFNLADHRSWLAGTLGFGFGPSATCFEANNAYWLPQREALINVEAHGDSGDLVEQLDALWDASGEIHFTSVATVAVDHGIVFNWVDGLAYNASIGAIAFSAGYWAGSMAYSYVLPFGPNGDLSTQGERRTTDYNGTAGPSGQLLEIQRYVSTSDYVLGQSYGPTAWTNGTQFLFDPWNGSVRRTNRSLDGTVCGNSCFEGQYPASSSFYLDFSATLALNNPMYRVLYAYRGPATTPPRTYAVTFSEAGLPAGANWSVSVNGTRQSSPGPSIVFGLADGNYSFSISPPSGYTSEPRAGTFSVANAPVTKALLFSPFAYPITFRETGLPSGTNWTVRVNGSNHTAEESQFTVPEPNGSYSFVVEGPSEFNASPRDGQFSVAGAGEEETISFVPADFEVTFAEVGLPSGQSWSVTVLGGPNASTSTSNGTTVRFEETAGQYSFEISPVPGFLPASRTGSFSVRNQSVTVSIAFQPAGTTEVPGFLGFTGDTGYLLIALLVVVGAAIATVVLLRRPSAPSRDSPER